MGAVRRDARGGAGVASGEGDGDVVGAGTLHLDAEALGEHALADGAALVARIEDVLDGAHHALDGERDVPGG